MNLTKKEIRQSLSSQINRQKAEFVTTNPRISDRFKYILGFSLNKYIGNRIIAINNIGKKLLSGPRILVQKVDFFAIRNQTIVWFTESLIEGLLINFAVWALLGWPFTPITMLAWGVVTKQAISVYWRLRKHGTTATIP